MRFAKLMGVLALLLFAALAVLSKGWLEPQGMAIFDSHLRGYEPQEARAYLAALSAEARALYLGLYRWLDSALPLAIAAALGAAIWRHAAGLHPALRLMLLLGPASYLVMDLAENAVVADLLRASGPLPEAQLRAASGFTQAKWCTLGVAVAVWLWAWFWGPRERKGTNQ
jgi:hypothetical protein